MMKAFLFNGLALALVALAGCAEPPAAIMSSPAGLRPQFGLLGTEAVFLTYNPSLYPLTPTGAPALDEAGRLYLPMLAEYTGPVGGPTIQGTLAGRDRTKIFITPQGGLLGGEFDVLDVITDANGDTLVMTATGSGTVDQNGRVPFTQTFTVVAAAGEAATTGPYTELIGRTYPAAGSVTPQLNQIHLTIFTP